MTDWDLLVADLDAVSHRLFSAKSQALRARDFPAYDKARRALNEGGYWDQVDPTPGRPHGKTRPPEGDRARKRNTEGR